MDDYERGVAQGVKAERHRILMKLLPDPHGETPIWDIVKCQCDNRWFSSKELRLVIEGDSDFE